MVQINQIIKVLKPLNVVNSLNVNLTGLTDNSTQVQSGFLFIAIKGHKSDGHSFIPLAEKNGAAAIICNVLPNNISDNVVYIVVEDTLKDIGLVASAFYSNPSEKINLVGVTGTNGKTTTATLLYKLFTELGYKCGLLSTVANYVVDKVYQTKLTTPDPITINELLSQMITAGCTYCFMEVSSHAIVQHRINGLNFKGGIFTNITHDHLDYHGTFKEYIQAKKMFFDNLPSNSFALINADDKNAQIMVQNTNAKIYTFGLKTMTDFKGKILDNQIDGMQLLFDNTEFYTPFIGTFNAYNLLGIYSVASILNFDKQTILQYLSGLTTVNGRFETIRKNGITAIVDYAHTPDALENVLLTINQIKQSNQKLITVVGAGGDRDKTKRPLMAKLAAELSNRTLLTSDNPRTENPEAILDDMFAGLDLKLRAKVIRISDRSEAIKSACILASKGDIILIAGKGHENYQEINGVRHHFDDKEVVEQHLELINL